MGYNMLILEDDAKIQNNIKSLILSVDATNKVLVTDQAEVAENWARKHSIDIFYVDIQLAGKKTGWDFIKQIQETHPGRPVIVVSSTATQIDIIDAFNDQLIFLTIDKPYHPEHIFSSYDKAVTALNYVVEDSISFKVDDISRKFKAKDIYYVQNHPKKQKKALMASYNVVNQNRVEIEVPMRGSIMEIAKQFKQEKTLLRCHQSYLVNPRHIVGYHHKDEELELVDGSKIPVGPTYFNEIKLFI